MCGTYVCIISNLCKEIFRVVIIILKSQLLEVQLKETRCIRQGQGTNYCQRKFSSEVSWSLPCTSAHNSWQLAEMASLLLYHSSLSSELFCFANICA